MTERTLREKIEALQRNTYSCGTEWVRLEEVLAILDAHSVAQPVPTDDAAHCEYCDGTGDAHRIDGEWLGTCDCALARANHTAEQPADLQLSAPKVGSAPQDQTEVSSGPSAAPTENTALVEAIRWAHDTLWELNPSNYNHDDVCRLNDASVEVILGLAPLLGERHGKSPEWWAARAALASREAKPGPDAVAEAAKVLLSQPKKADSPFAEAFFIACAYLADDPCGIETTNEIIETFLKTLAGEND